MPVIYRNIGRVKQPECRAHQATGMPVCVETIKKASTEVLASSGLVVGIELRKLTGIVSKSEIQCKHRLTD